MISQSGDPVIQTGTTAANPAWSPVPIKDKRGNPSFATSVTIRNEDATHDLNVSLDGGTTFITIKQGDTEGRTFDGPLVAFAVQASAGTAKWSAVASVA